ncbi:MAG: poly(A) polymerase, partial [Oceanospirillaceae bacterium]
SGEDLENLGEWWTEYQFASGERREQMTKDLGKAAPKKRVSKKPKENEDG